MTAGSASLPTARVAAADVVAPPAQVFAATAPAQRALIAGCLRRFDAQATFADDCEQALLQVLAGDLHLVLLDARLPGMPATEACDLIRRQEAALPIIALAEADLPLAGHAFTAVLHAPLDAAGLETLFAAHLHARPVLIDPAQVELDAALATLRRDFVEQLDARYLDAMRRLRDVGDNQALRGQAHRLAGSAACHRLDAVAVAAAALERALRDAAAPARIAGCFTELLAASASTRSRECSA